ncbi:MAG: hypothetical protein AB1665_01240 [Candidatus Thermoplasmatota archaeon]
MTLSQDRLFIRACRWAGARFAPTARRRERERERMRHALLVVKKELVAAQEQLARVKAAPEKKRDVEAALSRVRRIEQRAAALEERLHAHRFKKAAAIAGLPAERYEVQALALAVSTLALVISLALAPPLLLALGTDLPTASMLGFVMALLGSVGSYVLIVQHPFSAAKRAKILALGRSPEALCYMVMSMHLTPSLDRAVSFAAEHAEEPLSSALRRVVWDLYTRRKGSVEEAFQGLIEEWGEGNEELKIAFHSLIAATVEKEPEGRKRVLDKANEVALEGTRRRIEEFASGLSGPSTILFALGILLPLVVGSMLPLMALGSLDIAASAGLGMSAAPSNPLAIILFMDIVFPLGAWLYARSILGRRPGTASPPLLEVPGFRGSLGTGGLIIVAFSLLGIALPLLMGEGWALLSALLILGGIALAVGSTMRGYVRAAKEVRAKVERLESEFPDALFQLGRKVDEGMPLEIALVKVAEEMKDTEVSVLFSKVSGLIRVMGIGLEDALFHPKLGVLQSYPSRVVRATLRAVMQAVERDPSAAAKMMTDLSGYLRDLRKTDQNVKVQLGGTVDNMQNTAVLFAPLIMGVTVGLYALLGATFATLGTVQMMQLWQFALVLGTYLMLMVVVISYFTANLLHIGDRYEFRRRLGNSMPTAWMVYAAAVLLSYAMFV